MTQSPTFLQECYSVPQVRDRLSRGIKLQELNQLQNFLEQHRQERFVQKEYGHLYEDLDFLRSSGALEPPEVPSEAFVSVVRHWVAIKGYFSVDSISADEEGLEKRYIINTHGIRTPVLVMDKVSWDIYKLICSSSRLHQVQALVYLVYILEALYLSEESYGIVVDESTVRHVVRSYTASDLLPMSLRSLMKLVADGRVSDSDAVLCRLLESSYCIPSSSWINLQQRYYQMVVPSWTLTNKGNEDYTGNYFDGWEFFCSEDA